MAQLTKALSNEWTGKGINVNAIAPGYMATEMNTALLNDEGRNTEDLGRIRPTAGAPGRYEGAVHFLASDASDYIRRGDPLRRRLSLQVIRGRAEINWYCAARAA